MHHARRRRCDHFRPLSRREALLRCANGFGALALAGMSPPRLESLLDERRLPHHPARAKRIIFLYMDGAPSQVDTFDPKPRLEKEHGQPIGLEVPDTQFDNVGTVLKSPWKFKQYGDSGAWVSDLFPYLSRHVDDLCFVHSMVAEFPEHTDANYFLHTGFGQQGRPSMGSWISYGLGSENRNLPAFIVLNGGLIPPGGLDNFNAGFLPATFQGSVFLPGSDPVANLARADVEAAVAVEERQRRLLRKLEGNLGERMGQHDAIESAIANYELAFRMQAAVPELLDVSGETKATRELYGLDAEDKHTRTYGTLCLLARRLAERDVRFIELTCPNVGVDRWDQHNGLTDGHNRNARAIDQPIAGLLHDLKARGLLEDTLVLWAGEFGRTPMAQGAHGRDHNPHGFTIWMAGGGVRPGFSYGATDEYGYFAADKPVTMHDLHATILHLMGMDHERLSYPFSGRDMRLTDVHGTVVGDLLS